MKTWEYSMTSAMRVAMNQNKYDTLNLYLKLEKASKKYLESGEMKEGDVFFTPLENGAFLEQHFFKNYSVLDVIRPDKQVIHVISKDDSCNHEYRQLLGYSQALEDSGLGIGPKYPEKLVAILKDLKVGQVLVCENGRSYVCEQNTNGWLQLVRTSDTTAIPHFSAFQNNERISVLLSDNISIQHFYAQIRDNHNDDVRFRVTTTHRAQELLNQCFAGLNDKTKLLKIGPNEIRVKKSLFSKELTFYGNDGSKISENSVKMMLGWLDVAPVITEFERKAHTPETEFNDNMMRSDFDTLFSLEGYDEAHTLIAGYCLQNKGAVSINFKSYVNGEAISFIFKYHNGNCQIYKATYEDNNFLNDPTKLEPSTTEEFVSFCKIKYKENFIRVRNEVQNNILKDYPQYHGEFLDKVIDTMTKNKIKGEKLFGPKVSPLREDLSSLIESFEKGCEHELE